MIVNTDRNFVFFHFRENIRKAHVSIKVHTLDLNNVHRKKNIVANRWEIAE
jgi:hypothetical protein